MHDSPYTPPTGPELRALLQRWELSTTTAGALCDVHKRTVRRWCSPDVSAGNPPIPYAALFTLGVKREGVVLSRDRWREQLEQKSEWREELARIAEG